MKKLLLICVFLSSNSSYANDYILSMKNAVNLCSTHPLFLYVGLGVSLTSSIFYGNKYLHELNEVNKIKEANHELSTFRGNLTQYFQPDLKGGFNFNQNELWPILTQYQKYLSVNRWNLSQSANEGLIVLSFFHTNKENIKIYDHIHLTPEVTEVMVNMHVRKSNTIDMYNKFPFYPCASTAFFGLLLLNKYFVFFNYFNK